jgi:hypothetical protein
VATKHLLWTIQNKDAGLIFVSRSAPKVIRRREAVQREWPRDLFFIRSIARGEVNARHWKFLLSRLDL